MKHIAVITTVGNAHDARRIARELVERRLVACAHISEIESVYVWKGALENDKEFRVLLKTTDARYDEVERAIKAMHPYELPAIYATSLERVYAPYAEWLEANSSPA